MTHRNIISIKSGNGVGKTYMSACLVLWYLYTHYPCVVLTTAPTERQVKELLWREIRHLKRGANIKLDGRVLTMKIDIEPKHYALGFSTDDIQQMQGFHSANMLILIDEANGFPEELYEAIDGLLSDAENNHFVQIGNPIDPTGRFFTSFSDGETHPMTISCLDHPNVRTGKQQIPGAVSAKWVERMRRLWGEDSAFWQARILGEFPKTATDIVVNLGWAETAEKIEMKKIIKSDVKFMGVDVGEFGGDPCVWVIGTLKGIITIRKQGNIETMECVGITIKLMKEHDIKPDNVSVDSIGLGSGVSSRLHEQGYKINRFKASYAAVEEGRFKDTGTEAYWLVRNMLNPSSDIYMPYSFNGRQDMLKSELCTRKYSHTSTGHIVLEDKKRYRVRMKRSPNYADAFSMCYSPLLRAKLVGLTTLPDVY